MKVKRQYIYLGLIVIFLGIILSSIYNLLGGFEEIKIYELVNDKKIIAGRYFSGKQTSTEINEMLNATRALILDSQIRGTMSRVSYSSDTLKNNEVSYFIGLILDEDMAEIPSDFEVRELDPRYRLAVFLSMNHWVRPVSSTVEKMLNDKAIALGYQPPNCFVEIYYVDNSMSVEAWRIE